MRKIPEGYEDTTWRDVLRALGAWLDAIAAVVPVLIFVGTAWLAARVIILKDRAIARLRKGLEGEGCRTW